MVWLQPLIQKLAFADPYPQAATSGGVESPDVNPLGLSQVYKPADGGKVDIVLVHGLGGNPKKTWTAERSGTYWPAQLLPPVLKEQRARILVYGYDSSVASFTDGVSNDKIHNHAESLVATLAANRRQDDALERPIIFIAHSLGGLVVKRALLYSNNIQGERTAHLRSVFVSTFGILFMGTPHKGSDLAKWGTLLESICRGVMPSRIIDTNSSLVKALKNDNETLQVIDREFYQIMGRFRVYYFHEGKKTNLGRLKTAMVVDEESASPNAQDVERAVIQQDHSHMCKFESRTAPGFDLVADALQRYSSEAVGVISLRWQQEGEERARKQKYRLAESVPGKSKRYGCPQDHH